MSKPKRENIKIEKLHQLTTNPRTIDAVSDFDAVEKLYKVNRQASSHLINLALEIADKGFDENEPIYAVQHGNTNEYDVYEGNRRLAALNLLSDPNKYGFLSKKHKKVLQQANLDKVPTEVEVTIVNKDEAQRIMARNHDGMQNGIGRVAWDTESSRRYARSMGKDASYVGKATSLFKNMFGKTIGEYIGGITSADRILNNKAIQMYIGAVGSSGPTSEQVEKIKRVLDEAKLVSDEKDMAISRTFGKKKDIEALIPRLEQKNAKENDDQTGNSGVEIPVNDDQTGNNGVDVSAGDGQTNSSEVHENTISEDVSNHKLNKSVPFVKVDPIYSRKSAQYLRVVRR